MKSVIQFEKECYICGRTTNLHVHHLLHGTANRKLSDKYGYWVYLCVEHHVGNNGVHQKSELDMKFKQLAQMHYEKHRGTRQDFINEFGKSWL